MRVRQVGDRTVSAIGLGAMWLSLREDRPTRRQAIRTIHASLDAGIRLVDTADAYCHDATEFGHNERLVGAAVRSWSGGEEVLVATKGGHVRDTAGGWSLDGSPAYLRKSCERSLRALGQETIDLYFYHRPDPAVPWEESIGCLAELQREGKIREVGISNASPDLIRQAVRICRVAAVQNELSPALPAGRVELELCAELGVSYLPWRPLSGATGTGQTAHTLAKIAAAHGVSPQRVTLAWLLSLGEHVLPIAGATRPETAVDSAAAATLVLPAAQTDAIATAVGR